MALIGLAQGIPFFHAGDDILRSKSFDKNSYNSGDWFNKLDWAYQTNNFAVGLPQAGDNQGDWATMDPFLVNPALKPGFTSIYSAHLYFEDILRIRKSSPLFRLQTGDEVKKRVKFYNAGPNQQPGLIVMAISDKVGRQLDRNAKSIVVDASPPSVDFRIEYEPSARAVRVKPSFDGIRNANRTGDGN